jgi:ferredoxin
MKKYKIIFDREVCIGALACSAVSPDLWEIAKDGKVDLKGAKKNSEGKWELVIEEKDLQREKDAAHVCPVEAIKIITLDKVNEK